MQGSATRMCSTCPSEWGREAVGKRRVANSKTQLSGSWFEFYTILFPTVNHLDHLPDYSQLMGCIMNTCTNVYRRKIIKIKVRGLNINCQHFPDCRNWTALTLYMMWNASQNFEIQRNTKQGNYLFSLSRGSWWKVS